MLSLFAAILEASKAYFGWKSILLAATAFALPNIFNFGYILPMVPYFIQRFRSHAKLVKQLKSDPEKRKQVYEDIILGKTTKVSNGDYCALYDCSILQKFWNSEEGGQEGSGKTKKTIPLLAMSMAKYTFYADKYRTDLNCFVWPSVQKLGAIFVLGCCQGTYLEELPYGQKFYVEGRIVGYDEVSYYNEMKFVSYRKVPDRKDQLKMEKVVHAVILARSQLTRKKKMRDILDDMGLQHLPDTHFPFPDIKDWVDTITQTSNRVKEDMQTSPPS